MKNFLITLLATVLAFNAIVLWHVNAQNADSAVVFDRTGITATVPIQTIFTPTISRLYTVSTYVNPTTYCTSGNSTAIVRYDWTDDSGTTQSTAADGFGLNNAFANSGQTIGNNISIASSQFSVPPSNVLDIWLAAGTPFRITTTIVACTVTGTAVYSVHSAIRPVK